MTENKETKVRFNTFIELLLLMLVMSNVTTCGHITVMYEDLNEIKTTLLIENE